jgi:outer membrane immunogenic protein
MHRTAVAFGLSAIVVLGAGSFASAADMPAKAPVYKAPTAAAYNWAGFYIGGHIGGGWSKTNLTNTQSDGAIAWPDLDIGQSIGLKQSGIVGGGQIGYNFQNGNWVYGVELSGSGANINGGGAPPPGAPFSAGDDNFESKIRALLLVTGRLGYAWDRTLLYAKGGYAGASIRTSVADSTCPLGPPTSCGSGSDTSWRSGFTVGAGLEYAVANNWIVGVEYDYPED